MSQDPSTPATPTLLAHSVFHEPNFNESQDSTVPPYFTEDHPSDNGVYRQIDTLLAKKVVSFETSRIAHHEVYPLESAYGSYGPTVINGITQAGQIVFDILGDSGASDKADFAHEVAVASDVSEYINSTHGRDRPVFMFHLGDIVYSFGEAKYYFDQFYSPFRNYAAPIIAIPGNHDSFIVPGTQPDDEPLKIFQRNFCALSPQVTPEAKSLHRTAMTQPGVYFTLDAPFVRIIGLFSNALEDPGVISSQNGRWPNVPDVQLDFLTQQLTRIRDEHYEGAVILATHHPSFSYTPPPHDGGTGGGHGSSTEMLAQIDAICQTVGVYPHAILAGHAHNMQRYTRTLTVGTQTMEIPFIVAGASGHHVNSLVRASRGQQAQEPALNSDVSYMDASKVFPNTQLVLNNYEDTDFGYLRCKVTADTLRFDYFRVGDDQPYDTVMVGLKSRKIQ